MFNKLSLKSDFGKNVLTLMTGTTIAQAIPIAISPILTRLYSPEDFGLLAIYMSMAAIFIVLATGRYELAIILPKKDSDAFSLVILSLLITLTISIILFVIFLFFNEKIAILLKNKEIANWLYFIPLTILLTGFYNSFFYWFNRKKRYKDLSKANVSRSLTTATSNLTLGYAGLGATGLLSSAILGQGLTTAYLAKKIKKDKDKFITKVNKLKILALAKKYIKFPKFNTQHAFANTLFSQMPIFILSSFFLSAVTGFYSLAMRVIQTPISIIGSSMSTVLYEKVTAHRNKKELFMGVIYKFLKLQFLLSLVLFMAIYIISYYFSFIFGDKWEEVGGYIRVLIPWLFMVFLASPLAFAINLSNNQEKGLMVEWAYGAVKLISLLVGAMYFKDIIITLKIFAISNAIFLFFQALWFISLLKEEEDYKKSNND